MKKAMLVAAAVAIASISYWALAQPAAVPLAATFPAGASLYLEAKDFSALLADWNGSSEKRAWLASSNYDAFSRSRLLLKLTQAQTEFQAAAGLPPDYALLSSVAGGNSALAIYNIGDLEFLYMTRLPSASALNTALWKARGTYQTRHAGGADYYVKVDASSHRTAAFAYTGGNLLLATSESLMAGALELAARQSGPSLASESWFAEATRAAAPGSNDVRMVYNLQRLLASPQFRSYWVQRNASSLREFTAGLADLERTSGNIEERRILLRATPAEPVDDKFSGQALAMVPDDAGFYRVQAQPARAFVEGWIEEKLFHAAAIAPPSSRRAPVVMIEGDAGSEQDLETRIDEAPLRDDRNTEAFDAWREAASGVTVQAALEVGSTRLNADQVFVGSDAAIVLIAQNAWNASAMETAVGAAAGLLWSDAGLGAGWRTGANGVRELDGLGRIAMAVDGRYLVLGDSPELVNAVFTRRNRAPAAGAVYAAGWRHARELPDFERMARLIDFPQIPPPQAGQDAAREPMFFSENLASLGRVLRRVQSAAITVRDAGTMLRESVDYKIAP